MDSQAWMQGWKPEHTDNLKGALNKLQEMLIKPYPESKVWCNRVQLLIGNIAMFQAPRD